VPVNPSPLILAVAPGPPFAPETFSGTSLALLLALERAGALAGAVDGRSDLIVFAERAASFAPRLERWKQRSNAGASFLSPLARAAMDSLSARRVAAALDGADALLQMTGYFNPGRPRPGLIRCSYHDGNLAGFLRRPDLAIAPDSRFVRRALSYERALYDEIDLIFCMSEQLRDSFVADFGQAPDKVVTVGAGPNLAAPARPPRRQLTPARFLFVGKQWERKGGPTLLKAFERLRAERPDAELVVVGPAGLSVSGPGVRVVGRVTRGEGDGDRRMAELYERATAFVLPAMYEPLGVAVIEAMAFGLPCIGTSGGALPELIADGTTGILVEPGDERGLCEAMRRLADDPDLCRSLGEAGAERYVQRFTWDAVAGRMVDAIAAHRSG
jgi:glycosyltransferase involved in cell wall biosynthesis